MDNIYYDQDGIVVRDAVSCDVLALDGRLRKSDVDEVWAAAHHTQREALQISYDTSQLRYTVVKDGVPVAMFGAAAEDMLDSIACVWLLATDELTCIQRRFVRHSRYFIGKMLDVYEMLFNFADCRNRKTLEWLLWCGAVFYPPTMHGPENRYFQLFTMRRDEDV